MKIFDGKKWTEITREERYFCAELFQCMKMDLNPFLELLIEKDEGYDIGFEVCFYRDVLKLHGLSARENEFPPKRTFDLMLISDSRIIIIEAKAQQGFTDEQLKHFEEDKESLKKLYALLGIQVPKIEIVALYSSGYTPSSDTTDRFDRCITWDKVAQAYKSAEQTFKRADEMYRK